MNSANYVDQEIKKLSKDQDGAWALAKLCIGWPYIFGDRGQYCTPSQRQTVYNKHKDQTGLITQCQVLNSGAGSCNGCKWYPSGLRVRSFDCRGFTYWVLLQIYNWELKGAGATSQWNTEANWKAKGTIDTIPDDMLVCLFYTQKGNPKVMQHTGLGYKGETVECGSGVQYFKTRNKKWTHWAVPACIDGEVPSPDPDKKPTLRRGDSGDWVKKAQELLIQKGYSLDPYGADGKFGKVTETAVKQLQKDCGLDADGVIGQATWDALESVSPVKPLYTVSIPHLTGNEANALLKQYPEANMIEERW